MAVCDPGTAHQILVATNRMSLPGSDPLVRRLPNTEETRQAMQTRRLIGRFLTPHNLRAHLPRLDLAMDSALRQICAREQFDPVAVAEEIFLHAVLPICITDPPVTLAPTLLKSVRAGLALADAAVRLPRWWPSMMRHRIRTARRRKEAELHDLFTTRPPHSAPPSDRQTLMELLQTDRVPAGQAVRALSDALLKGLFATAAAWCWLLHDLATQPAHLARITDEVTARPGPDRELPFTEAFVRESMRMHPPAWLLARDTIAPTPVTDRHTAPAGTTMLISPYLIHRDSRHWPEPDRFNPDRWISPRTEQHRHAYLPFGAGPRVCVGLHLGQTLLTLTAARIATHYRLAAAASPAAPSFGSLLRPAGLNLQLSLRE